MKTLTILAASFLVLTTSTPSLASTSSIRIQDEHEHTMGRITGQSSTGAAIELKAVDHGFAGSIKNALVMGHFSHEDFGSKIWVRHGDKLPLEGNFGELAEGGIGGEIRDGASKSVQIRFVRISKAEQKIYYMINGQEVAVHVQAPKFENNHFIEPTYTAQLDGQTLQFSFTGQACYGYSTHLIMMVLAGYLL